MDTAQQVVDERAEATSEVAVIQPCGYLLELSRDWIVRRASENIHRLLGESHVALIDEPLGDFVHAQALHDLRNLFSRLSGTTGIARAYAIRLTDAPQRVDIAFQLAGNSVLLEAVPSRGEFGERFGSVGGLANGLAGGNGQRLLDNVVRRMRALTGFDRVTLDGGDGHADSSRGRFAGKPAPMDLPAMIADCEQDAVPVFPRRSSNIASALLRAPTAAQRKALQDQGIRSTLSLRFSADAKDWVFRCDSRTPREPDFEGHAAAELFAQMAAMRLELAAAGR